MQFNPQTDILTVNTLMEHPYDDGMTEKTSHLIFIWAFENLNRITNFVPTIDRGVAQLASAHVWGTWGRKFESSHPDQNKKPPLQTQRWFLHFTQASKACFCMKGGNAKTGMQCHGFLFWVSTPKVHETQSGEYSSHPDQIKTQSAY